MSLSQRVVEEENRRAGRVIPAWRYHVGGIGMFVLGVIGWWVHQTFGGWWIWLVYLAAAILWEVVMGKFKKRSVV